MKKYFFLIFMFYHVVYTGFSQDDITVKFNPSGNLSIGRSIDINNPGVTKQKAFKNEELVWLDGGSIESYLKASLATNSEELYQKLNLDFNIQGEVKVPIIGGGKSEFDLKYEIDKEYSDNNLYYVIHAYNDFGRQELKDLTLKENFNQLLSQQKSKEFIRAVGTHFVVRQRRASMLYALVTISKLSSITKKSLNLSYNSSINLNLNKIADLSIQQKTSYKNFIKTASKLGEIRIEYFSSGTSGLSNLANGFPQTIDDLPSILKALADAASSITKENSTPIEYHLASFESPGLDLPVYDRSKNECLSKLTNKKLIIKSYSTKVQKILVKYPNSSFKNYYSSKAESLNKTLRDIERKEKDCRENGICCNNNVDVESIYWLEDLISIDNSYVQADYIPIYYTNGNQAGEIIKSLKLVIEGVVQNEDYYCCMNGYYLNVDFEPIRTNVQLIDNTNPTLDVSNKEGYFSKRQFIYVIDLTNINYEYNSDSKVIYNNVNLDKSRATVDKLRRNNYFIEVESRDGLKNFVDIGAFDFNEINTLKIN